MRLLFGIILGAALTIGVAYIQLINMFKKYIQEDQTIEQTAQLGNYFLKRRKKLLP